jgi:hypothetical protein
MISTMIKTSTTVPTPIYMPAVPPSVGVAARSVPRGRAVETTRADTARVLVRTVDVRVHWVLGRRCDWARPPIGRYDWKGEDMIIVGVVLLLIGLLAGIPILWTIGVILAVVGAILWIFGAAGREVGGRRHYY